ncbi:hypothetical protein ES708_33778 [subsurface metagenome]
MDQVDHYVILAPVVIEQTDQKYDQDKKTVRLNSNDFTDEIMNALVDYNVFRKLIVFSGLSKQEMIEKGKSVQTSFLLTVKVKDCYLYYVGSSEATIGTTFLWFMLGVPSFWTRDQVYGIKLDAEVSFVELKDKNISSTYTLSLQKEGGLNFLERGFSLYVFLVPPNLCPENWDKIEEQILPKAQKLFALHLAQMIKEMFRKPSEATSETP